MALLALLGSVVVLIVLLALVSVRRIREDEYGVLFRMGKVKGGAEGPGMLFRAPFLDTIVRVDTCPQSSDVLIDNTLIAEDLLPVESVDGFPVEVEATVHYKVFDPERSVTEVEDYRFATREVVRSVLYSLISESKLDEISYEIGSLSKDLQNATESPTAPWGVEILRLEAKDVRAKR